MSESHVIDNGFAFLQQIQLLLARGYTNYFIGTYPIKKEDKFEMIDKKIIQQYKCDLNKDKIYYRKKKGLCNVKFLRHKNIYLLLKTNGKEDIDYENNYLSIKETNLTIKLSDHLTVEFFYDSQLKITLKIEKQCFRDIRETIRDYLDARRFNEAANKFSSLNGIPAYAGVIVQKKQLKQYLMKYVKQHSLLDKEGLKRFKTSLRIHTRRTMYTIYEK